MLCSETLESHARVRISSASFFFLLLFGSLLPCVPIRRFRGAARARDGNRHEKSRENATALPSVCRRYTMYPLQARFLVMTFILSWHVRRPDCHAQHAVAASSNRERTEPQQVRYVPTALRRLQRDRVRARGVGSLAKNTLSGQVSTRTHEFDASRPTTTLRQCWTARRN